MNRKIDFIRMLVDDIAAEQEYIKEYKKASRQCEIDKKEQGEDFKYWKHPFSSMRVPSRTKIKDDVKMIRRLALEIAKEEI